MDKNRKESPLIFVQDAVLIDSTKINVKQMEDKLNKLVKKAINNKYGNL
jgi:cytidylate kinase